MRRIIFVVALAILTGTAVNAATTDVGSAYQEFEVANCTDPGDCAVVFPATTADHTLILHASCSFSLAPGGTITKATLSTQNAKANNQLSASPAGTSSNGLTTYQINAQTYLFVNKGDLPKVDVYGFGSVVQDLACTVSGSFN